MTLSVIYQPQGRAREYADWAASLWSGCSNKCSYCFAPAVLRKTRDEFHARVSPRPNIQSKFLADCNKMLCVGVSVLFSFTCDPYPPEDNELRLTRWGIQVLHRHGMHVNILTKGKDATRDFDILTPHDAFACTLTFLDPDASLRWEPNAALPDERIAALKDAHARGIPTWASLEPVIVPTETLRIIEQTHEFVDLYKIGMLNYVANTTDWEWFGNSAVRLLESLGAKYYLKNDLRKKMGLPDA